MEKRLTDWANLFINVVLAQEEHMDNAVEIWGGSRLTARMQQAECQSRALKFSLISLKEGMGGIKEEKKKKLCFEQGRIRGVTKDRVNCHTWLAEEL